MHAAKKRFPELDEEEAYNAILSKIVASGGPEAHGTVGVVACRCCCDIVCRSC